MLASAKLQRGLMAVFVALVAAIVFSLVILAAGLAAFLLWARAEREWPFGPKHIREEFRAVS